jgi:glucose-6-phosphate 1-dehydrogenase
MHVAPISLDVEFKTVFDSAPDAYERLIHNVFRGDAALFPRSEEVEQSRRIVDPLLRAWAEEGLPELYTSGSDGPSSASAMLASQGREWRPLRGR